MKNLNRTLMLIASAAIILMAAPSISALAKDDTARQLVSFNNEALENAPNFIREKEEKQASR